MPPQPVSLFGARRALMAAALHVRMAGGAGPPPGPIVPPSAMNSKIQWDDLRLIAQVVQSNSLAGAARALGVDHSTVSRRMAALEKTLGATLVIRGTEGVSLTAVGQRIAPLLLEMVHLAAEIQNSAQQQATRVRVSMPSGFARFFSHDLEAFQQRTAGIELELLTGERVHGVEEGEVDLAIRVGEIGDDRLVARPLCKAGWTLYASRDYLARRGFPGSLDDLSGHDLIGYSKGLGNVPAARWLERRSQGARVVLRINQVAEMVPAALRGVGLALLPCGLADGEPDLVRLTPYVLAAREVSLVYRRVSRLPASVRAAITLVSEVILQHAKAIEGGELLTSPLDGADAQAADANTRAR